MEETIIYRALSSLISLIGIAYLAFWAFPQLITEWRIETREKVKGPRSWPNAAQPTEVKANDS